MLQKIYGVPQEAEKRYSPAVCLGAEVRVIQGDPDPELISTSYVERQNLTMRMRMRRFTRLTNAFSKKVENLAAAVALHFMHYNFARPHAGLADPYPRTPAPLWRQGWPITSGRFRRSQGSWTCPFQTDPLPVDGFP